MVTYSVDFPIEIKLTFKYFDRALPKAIMNLYNKSLHDPKKITRSIEACSLHPKPFLKPGNMMFNIITHWNQISPSLRNEKSLKEFKDNQHSEYGS